MPRAINRELRERIVATAHGLFFERGYKSVSMEDIAREVGLKKANLFHYYPSKELLALAVLEKSSVQYRSRIVAEFSPRSEDPIEQLAAMYTGMAERILNAKGEIPSVVGNVIVEMSSSHESLQQHIAEDLRFWINQLTGFMQHWKDESYFGPRLNPRSAAVSFVALMHGATVQWKATLDIESFTYSAQTVREFLRSMRT